jgi:hypothetical protein
MTIFIAAMVFGDMSAASGDGTGIGIEYQRHDQSHRQQKAGED